MSVCCGTWGAWSERAGPGEPWWASACRRPRAECGTVRRRVCNTGDLSHCSAMSCTPCQLSVHGAGSRGRTGSHRTVIPARPSVASYTSADRLLRNSGETTTTDRMRSFWMKRNTSRRGIQRDRLDQLYGNDLEFAESRKPGEHLGGGAFHQVDIQRLRVACSRDEHSGRVPGFPKPSRVLEDPVVRVEVVDQDGVARCAVRLAHEAARDRNGPPTAGQPYDGQNEHD